MEGFPFKALEAVLEYNWEDEKADYERHVEENGDGSGHVFEHLQKLDAWLRANLPGLKKKETS